MPTERFNVDLVLRAQRVGEKAFAETEAGLKIVRDAVKKFAEMQAAGMPTAEAYKDAIARFRDKALEAGLAIEYQAQAVKSATRAIDRYREAEAAGLPFDEAVAISTTQNTVAQTARAAATNASSGATTGNSTATKEQAVSIFMLTGMVQAAASWQFWLATAIVATTLVIWPFIVAITTAVVAMISWAVAGAAALVLLAALTIGFAGLGLGLIAVANHFREVDPAMKKFTGAFKSMGEEWADRARPAVNELLHFMDRLLPAIGRTGDSIIKWFTNELPKVLGGVSKLIKDLSPDFIAFGKFMGKAFDHAGPTLFKFFEIMTKGGLKAVEGLTVNLLKLAAWFNTETPKWAPIWDQVGRVIQWFASIWVKFNDWLVSNWPGTMKQVQDFLDKVQDAWKRWGPKIETIAGLIEQFVQVGLQQLIDHAGALVPLFLFIGLAFLAAIAILAILAGAFVTAADAIMNFLSNTEGQFTKWANIVISMVNAVIDGINAIPHLGGNIGHVPYFGEPGPAGPEVNQGKGGHLKNSPPSGTVGKSKSHSTQRQHSGGLVVEGEAYIIGKSGAEELFVPERGGRVFPINGEDVYVKAGDAAPGGGATTNIGPVIKSDSSAASSVSSVVNDYTNLAGADSSTTNQQTNNRNSVSWLTSLFSPRTNSTKTQNVQSTPATAPVSSQPSVRTSTHTTATVKSHHSNHATTLHSRTWNERHKKEVEREAAQDRKEARLKMDAHDATLRKQGITPTFHPESTWSPGQVMPTDWYGQPAGTAAPPPPVQFGQTVSTVANTNASSSSSTTNKIVNEIDTVMHKPLNIKGIDAMIQLLKDIEADLDAMRHAAPGITAASASRRNG